MKTQICLSENWQIHKLSPSPTAPSEILSIPASIDKITDGWYDAGTMPAQVHDILIRNGTIENYALEGCCDKYEWVAEQDWLYRCVFSCDTPDAMSYLYLKGLDTLTDVYLNGRQVAKHISMYRPLKVDTTGLLKSENVLLLHFHSPWEYVKNYELPEGQPEKIGAIRGLRKSSNDFSRYLGAQPRYSTPIGVFDDVVLALVDTAEIEYLDIGSHLNHDYTEGTVDINTQLNLSAAGNYKVKAFVRDENGVVVCSDEAYVSNAPGKASVNLTLKVGNPKLWWPKGYGAHPLYEVCAEVTKDGRLCDAESKKIGFREVTMEALFDFRINGKAVKLWGGNFAPIGVGGISHCFDHERFKDVMDLVDNGMNALRIWGPGDPYADALYDEADRRGILLWQEFYGGSNMHPETEAFFGECILDAEYLLKRLKHRPGILLWCGGNEFFMWAHMEDPEQHFYGERLYLDEYRELCRRLDPSRFYYPSCPVGGSYPNDPVGGDTHGLEHHWYFVPGIDYPYFFSENTRVSPPSMKSMLRFMTPEEIWPSGYTGKILHGDVYQIPERWIYHSAEASNAMWDKFGPVEYFYDPTNGEELVYSTAAARGWHFKDAVEKCRRGRPHYEKDRPRRCFGHFVWKLNATLPEIYSSVIDYYSEPYIPYYAMIRAYEPVLVSFEIDDRIYIWAVNDSGEKVQGTLVFKLFDHRNNKFVNTQEFPVSVGHDESVLVTDLFSLGMVNRQHILCAWLYDTDGRLLAEKIDYLDTERHFTFQEARLRLRAEGDELVVSTDKFARCVELEGDDKGDQFNWLFSDNYFDVLPGYEKRIKIKGRHKAGVITAKAHYSANITKIDYTAE